MEKHSWKWGTLEDLEIQSEKPTDEDNYFNWMPGGPWIERPPSFNSSEIERIRKVIDCFTLNLLTGCFIERCDRVMDCGNTELCYKLLDLSKKVRHKME